MLKGFLFSFFIPLLAFADRPKHFTVWPPTADRQVYVNKCPAGITCYEIPLNSDGEIDLETVDLQGGVLVEVPAKLAAKRAVKAQVRADELAQSQARADAKAIDPTKIKTLQDAIDAITKMQKAMQ